MKSFRKFIGESTSFFNEVLAFFLQKRLKRCHCWPIQSCLCNLICFDIKRVFRKINFWMFSINDKWPFFPGNLMNNREKLPSSIEFSLSELPFFMVIIDPSRLYYIIWGWICYILICLKQNDRVSLICSNSASQLRTITLTTYSNFKILLVKQFAFFLTISYTQGRLVQFHSRSLSITYFLKSKPGKVSFGHENISNF